MLKHQQTFLWKVGPQVKCKFVSEIVVSDGGEDHFFGVTLCRPSMDATIDASGTPSPSVRPAAGNSSAEPFQSIDTLHLTEDSIRASSTPSVEQASIDVHPTQSLDLDAGGSTQTPTTGPMEQAIETSMNSTEHSEPKVIDSLPPEATMPSPANASFTPDAIQDVPELFPGGLITDGNIPVDNMEVDGYVDEGLMSHSLEVFQPVNDLTAASVPDCMEVEHGAPVDRDAGFSNPNYLSYHLGDAITPGGHESVTSNAPEYGFNGVVKSEGLTGELPEVPIEDTYSSAHGLLADTTYKEEEIPRSGPSYQCRYILTGHTLSISSLKFSPNGKMLASAGALCSHSIIPDKIVHADLDDQARSRQSHKDMGCRVRPNPVHARRSYKWHL